MSDQQNFATDRAFAYISLGTVIAGIVAGFWLLGSPAKQRLIAQDTERIRELQEVVFTITDITTADEPLPDTAPPARFGYRDFKDPVTNEPYEYRRIDNDTYELCAIFATDSTDKLKQQNTYARARGWEHPAGRHCFRLNTNSQIPISEQP